MRSAALLSLALSSACAAAPTEQGKVCTVDPEPCDSATASAPLSAAPVAAASAVSPVDSAVAVSATPSASAPPAAPAWPKPARATGVKAPAGAVDEKTLLAFLPTELDGVAAARREKIDDGAVFASFRKENVGTVSVNLSRSRSLATSRAQLAAADSKDWVAFSGGKRKGLVVDGRPAVVTQASSDQIELEMFLGSRLDLSITLIGNGFEPERLIEIAQAIDLAGLEQLAKRFSAPK